MPDDFLSIVAGLHVPIMPLVDVVGKTGTVLSEQTVSIVPNSNVGNTFWFTVTVNVAAVAQTPPAGVKVYTPEVCLFISVGFHVPVMPFSDEAGKAGTKSSAQIVSVVPNVNVGFTLGVTVTFNVVGDAHPPPGVKVYIPEF